MEKLLKKQLQRWSNRLAGVKGREGASVSPKIPVPPLSIWYCNVVEIRRSLRQQFSS